MPDAVWRSLSIIGPLNSRAMIAPLLEGSPDEPVLILYGL